MKCLIVFQGNEGSSYFVNELNKFDIAGFAVGVVEKSKILKKKKYKKK